MKDKKTVIIVAMVLIAILAVVFLISQVTTYSPPRHLTWEYSYQTDSDPPTMLNPDNVWFNVFEVVGTNYIKLGSTQDTTYNLLTRNPQLYDNQEHTWVLTAWCDSLQQESFYSESVSAFLPTPPITRVKNLEIRQ